MGELADRARLSKQNMTTLMREVDHSGLVVRPQDEADGRAQRVWLTARAEEFRPAAARILEEMDAMLLSKLSPRAVGSLRRSLGVIMPLPRSARQRGD